MTAPALRPIRPLGDAGFLIDCADLDDAVSVHAAVTGERSPLRDRVTDCVVGARTVALRGIGIRRSALQSVLQTVRPLPLSQSTGESPEITIDVVYNGEDLEDVAAHLDRSVASLIDWHTSTPFVAAFAGFAPGFFYCVPAFDSDVPEVPRRADPRASVPAGSVALAGGFSAVYPRSVPGGWQLVGTTAERMFDPDRDPPALLHPGARVRYRAARESAPLQRESSTSAVGESAAVEGGAAVTASGPGAARALLVDDPGPATLVQDLGRPGLASIGITASGAADRGAATLANDLVGNERDAAVLETLLGGLRVTARGGVVIALTGAPAAAAMTAPAPPGGAGDTGPDADGSEDEAAGHDPVDAPFGRAFVLPDGHTLTLGQPTSGVRTYLAVRGGVRVAPVLGSRSTDTLSGLGPEPVRAGTALEVGPDPRRAVAEPVALESLGSPRDPGDPLDVGVVMGPRADWLTEESVRRFTEEAWVVGDRSDRVGIRLSGPALDRRSDAELPSEGVVAGSVQVTGSGQPVVFHRDHPVTGGYPVVACVVSADLDLLAQARPGTQVRFRPSP